VIANINTVLQRARDAGTPVIWIQHADEELAEGSDGWQYVDELKREDSEPLVHKHFGDSFEETELEALLAERKVGRLVVTGAQTDACIRSTLHGALVRGYDATLVADAHTTDDPSEWGLPLNAEQVIAHTNMYWKYSSAPGRSGGTVETAEVDFSSGA
jgi:nicotinamidase-related amidase